MRLLSVLSFLLLIFALRADAVPPVLNYAGQVAVNGEAFDGNGLFKFALVNTDGTTTYWSNDGTSVEGSEPQASVAVSVNGGLYAILLGNTAQQGMGAIDPALFAQHTDAKLRVWFSDGVNGFQQLSPDRPFASVPYAFNAESAKSADTANTAKAVQAGAVTSSMLASSAVTSDKLSPQIKADINATIGMNRLSTEVTEKLNQEKTTNNYNAPSVGSLLAVPYGSDAPAGYSLYQRGEPKELVWEEKAPVSVPRNAYNGVEVLDGKIFFVGGGAANNSAHNIAERYDPLNDTWETLNSMSVARRGVACAVLNGKFYAIGGQGLASVEVYDPTTESWAAGVALPSEVSEGTAITAGGKIYLIGGRNASDQNINQVLCFDPSTNQWKDKASMPTARHGAKLVWFENRIWAIGGNEGSASNKVESYDPVADSWQTETFLRTSKNWPVAWVTRSEIYVGGGWDKTSVEAYNPDTSQWSSRGNLPEKKYCADAVVLNDKVYLMAGHKGAGHSNKVFAADLNASVEGVYDLYRKDGDAPVGTPVVQSEYADGSVTASKMADGAVTASKMAEGAVSKSALDATILKYLKPEITTQPHASTIYAGGDGSVSFSAEGKYLSYQWKKDGADIAGKTNVILNITDANATLHNGNYSVVVSNDFGSVESGEIPVDVNTTWSTDGLVGWWKFDETSGTVAYDSSGNGYVGNLTNGPTWTTGKIGGALSFDGVDDHVIAHNFLGIGGSNPRSISAWIKTTSLDAVVCSYGTFQQSQKWTIRVQDWEGVTGAIRTEIYSGKIIGSTPVNDGSWFFVTSILEPNQSNISDVLQYINGNLDNASQVSSRTINTVLSSKFVIGRRNLLAAADDEIMHFNGLIDDLRIYDRALSAAEVQALYNLGQ